VWETEKPHTIIEKHIRDSPKVKVFCALSCDTVFGPFFFVGGWGVRGLVVNRIIYPIMFMLWLMPQLLEDKPNVVFLTWWSTTIHL
jgi:hypothetical protein